MINTPHNPTATVWSRDDFDTLAALIRNTNMLVISDEVYEHMVLMAARTPAFLRIRNWPSAPFVISVWKNVSRHRLEDCVLPAPKALMAEFRKAHQFVVFTVHTPFPQHATAEYMSLGTHRDLSGSTRPYAIFPSASHLRRQ